MTPHSLVRVARRLPLVPRAKPACPPLGKRLDQIRARAGSPKTAAAALNLAALTASDCGMPELARDLCLRQARVFASSPQGYDVPTAKLALQPIINLARLRTRDGAGDQAYKMLDSLFLGSRTGTLANIDDVEVDFAKLTENQEASDQIAQWLWTVMVSDGTRALVSVGRWAEALAHVQGYSGVEERMFEGRQVAILAHSASGDHDKALSMVRSTRTEEAWEDAVASTLLVLCLYRAGQESTEATAEIIDHISENRSPDGAILFRVRLGLCGIDLAVNDIQRTAAAKITITEAESTHDAHVARDLLSHPLCEPSLSTGQRNHLASLLRSSYIGAGSLPQTESQELEKVTQESIINLRHLAQ